MNTPIAAYLFDHFSFIFQVSELEPEDCGMLHSLQGSLQELMAETFLALPIASLVKHLPGYDGTRHAKLVNAYNKIQVAKARYSTENITNSTTHLADTKPISNDSNMQIAEQGYKDKFNFIPFSTKNISSLINEQSSNLMGSSFDRESFIDEDVSPVKKMEKLSQSTPLQLQKTKQIAPMFQSALSVSSKSNHLGSKGSLPLMPSSLHSKWATDNPCNTAPDDDLYDNEERNVSNYEVILLCILAFIEFLIIRNSYF